MNFISIEFLVFLPLVILIYRIIPEKLRWLLLLFVSYVCYSYWNQGTVFLLLGMTVITFFLAKMIERTRKKGYLIFAVVICMGSLFLFKYLGFFCENVGNLWRLFGRTTLDLSLKILLPVGISFYTFQTMSYVIDVYRGKRKAENNFGYYALYVAFFPQLVAGPIERSERLLPQLVHLKKASKNDLLCGLLKILTGFLKKIVIADFFGEYVDRVYQEVGHANGPAIVVATVLFAFQIYCDFSGYTDIAVGTAKMFGINLMENFNHPYLARSIRDFWRRWHISLTSWFTDYVYKPLGGSFQGKYRTMRNIMIVFLLSGLWHGAEWTFVLWGMIHGSYLILDRIIPIKSRCLTFFEVCFAWIFFRADNLKDVMIIMGNLLTGWSVKGLESMIQLLQIDLSHIFRIAFSIVILYFMSELRIFQAEGENQAAITNEKELPILGLIIFILVVIIALGWFCMLSENAGNKFIYFQF